MTEPHWNTLSNSFLTNSGSGLRSGDVGAVADAEDIRVLDMLKGLLVDGQIPGRVGQGLAGLEGCRGSHGRNYVQHFVRKCCLEIERINPFNIN